MIGTRYEEYTHLNTELPFVLRFDLERTQCKRSSEMNWHEDPEIQLCTDGGGEVLLNGEKYAFRKNDIVTVNPNVIHYTGTDGRLLYTCLIVKADFCRRMGIDCNAVRFSPRVESSALVALFRDLKSVWQDKAAPCRIARLNDLVLRILIELAVRHSVAKDRPMPQNRSFENVKSAVKYIRENYHRKLSLDGIAKAVYTDKYALCREFKALTGQTVVEHLNGYRCRKAAEYLGEGCTVTEAAALCGFENLSYFTKTFKKYVGALPSAYKKG